MKKSELDVLVKLIKQGLTKKKIRKKLGISTTALSNRLRRLEDMGIIMRKGKYEIEVLPSSHKHPRVTRIPISKKLNKRGHAFNVKILFPSEENIRDLPAIKDFFEKNKHKSSVFKTNFGSISFKYKKNTIWINKNSLTYYSNTSYYASDALHSKFYALKEIDNHIKYFKQKFGLRGVYGIELFREHYGLVFNEFAQWLLSNGRKLDVKDKGNKTILWVDDSRKDDLGLKEFESNNPLRINKADNYFKEHEETNWEVTPKFILTALDKIANNQNTIMDKVGFPRLERPEIKIDSPIPDYIN